MTAKKARTIPLLLSILAVLLAWSLTSTARAEVTAAPGAPPPTWQTTEQGRNLQGDGHNHAIQYNTSGPTAITLVTLSTRTHSPAFMIFGGVLLVVGASLIIVAAWRNQQEVPIN
jgi:hypothetical protein